MITAQGRVRWESKISSPFFPVVWCSAGYQEYHDSFVNQVNSKFARARLDHPSQPTTFEELRIFLQEAYQEMIRLHGEEEIRLGGLSVLVASRPVRYSDLWVVDGRRPIKQESRYFGIGSGEPYGELFLSQLWNENLRMRDVAELGCFIIKVIERFQLDESVGVGELKPQVWFVPDNPPNVQTEESDGANIREADFSLMENLDRSAELRLQKTTEFLDSLKSIRRVDARSAPS